MCSLCCDNAFLEYTEDVVEYFLNLPSMCACRSEEQERNDQNKYTVKYNRLKCRVK